MGKIEGALPAWKYRVFMNSDTAQSDDLWIYQGPRQSSTFQEFLCLKRTEQGEYTLEIAMFCFCTS